MEIIEAVLPALFRGAKITVQVTLQAGILALIVSVVVGVLRDASSSFIRIPIGVYVEFFRGTSAFVQIYWVYFALPLLGIQLSAIAAGTVVLGLNVGAYGSEVVRGALRAVAQGQREACIALNLSKWTALTRILLPQAMLRVIVPWSNLLIDLLKGTSLLSAITVTELAFAGRQSVSALGNPLLIFGVVLLMYLILAAPIAWASKFLDERLRRGLSVGRQS
ncbi:MAG: ectoine/hydroxyectoine ABC transporter permease subunit EhuC [Gammaproteobacteria bacterium]|nr:ectoine/hydroxyectoine ABC transporter permease subunit EhuC [Gammaproteobacteria bacterium]